MHKNYEAVKEILEDQMKKIVKKGDITPQELDNLYKASAIVLDFETKEAMEKQEKQKEEGQSQQGGYSGRRMDGRSYNRMSYNDGRSYDGNNSNHYPWFMYYGDGTYDMNSHGNSYGPIWNQEMENKSLHELHSQDNMGSNDRGNSNRRGVRGTGRNTSYDNAYDGAYDGAYEGAYDGSYDNSNDNSYRRGRDQRTGRYVSRDRGYSRAMDKERMIGKLEDMMDDAPSEKERRTLQQCVDKLERQ